MGIQAGSLAANGNVVYGPHVGNECPKNKDGDNNNDEAETMRDYHYIWDFLLAEIKEKKRKKELID
jgi:hypothetical protein